MFLLSMYFCHLFVFFFFFKQKTAYEMRISDWSSDVCSSDLAGLVHCVEKRIVSPVGSAVMGQSHKGVGPGITDAVAERHHALPQPTNSRGGKLHIAGKEHRAWSSTDP